MDSKDIFSKFFKKIFKQDAQSKSEAQNSLDMDKAVPPKEEAAKKETKAKPKSKKEPLNEKIAAMSDNEKTVPPKEEAAKKETKAKPKSKKEPLNEKIAATSDNEKTVPPKDEAAKKETKAKPKSKKERLGEKIAAMSDNEKTAPPKDEAAKKETKAKPKSKKEPLNEKIAAMSDNEKTAPPKDEAAKKETKAKLKSKKERLGEKIAAMSDNEKTAYLKKRKLKKIILFSALGLVVVGISFCGVYVYNIINNPAGFFEKDANESPSTTQIQLGDQYDYMLSIADKEIMKDTINVLLIGVDYAQEREDWNKYFYSDVMMVLAINFKENTVNMISVPRDTYAKISVLKDDRTTEKPEKDSIYSKEIGEDGGIFKLNSAIYHGGGIPDGFQNVCDSVSWELGGIKIDFYMGVTMPIVKELVNLIGGVDYNVDLNFTIQGRSYKIGEQHLDGQGVLDYLRVRKNVTLSGDLNRVNRQKKMLVAVFNKLKTTNLIFSVPEIIRALNGQLYTDMSFEQVAALAVFGSRLGDENISMYTMGGTQKTIFNWVYVITDQKKRVDIINKVYKINVPEYTKYSLQYCDWLWATMQGEKYIEIVNGILEKDAALPEESRKISVENVDNLNTQISDLTALMNTQNALKDKEKDGTEIDAKINTLKSSATSIFSAAGYTNISWFVNENPGRKRLTG